MKPEQSLLAVADCFLGLLNGAERVCIIPREALCLCNEKESESGIEVGLDEVSFDMDSTSQPEPVRHGYPSNW